MGNIICGQCETCCGKCSQEYIHENNPILIKKETINTVNDQYKNGKKILLTSPPSNINLFSNSPITDKTEKTDLSMSADNSPIKSFNNDLLMTIYNLISNQLYIKMINGERLHNILEPLTSYTNNILFDLILAILVKIREIYNIEFCDESEVNDLHQHFVKVYQELNNKNVLDDIKNNIEEDTRLKYNLLDIIEACVELYHFFKYKIYNGKEPYDKFYWEQYKNCNDFMKSKINGLKKGLNNINLSLGDNKLKIIE